MERTPGPWHYEGGRVWREGDYEDVVAYVDNRDDGFLMAAAPELLEAAEEVLANWSSGDLAAAVRELDAAVKQAKGEPA